MKYSKWVIQMDNNESSNGIIKDLKICVKCNYCVLHTHTGYFCSHIKNKKQKINIDPVNGMVSYYDERYPDSNLVLQEIECERLNPSANCSLYEEKIIVVKPTSKFKKILNKIFGK